jgi:hypothetical protein
MDDKDTKENPYSDFNKLDLNQLQSFSFGTQWTQDKSSPVDKSGQGDRPRRENRRDGPAAPRRDRRGFSKPAGGGHQPDSPRREPSQDRPAGQGARPARREFHGAPQGGAKFEGRGMPLDRGPYESPYYDTGFYPEDTSFAALAKTIRASYRTIELFEIARTVVAKNDRFIVVLTRKSERTGAGKKPLYISVPDGLPFESEEVVVNHVMSQHLGMFFETAEVEVDPPKGNYQVINRCGVTGELLGPPNYHLYNQIAQKHFETKVQRMSSEAFRARIESVRDPEVVAQWLEKMKKVTRFTWKNAEATAPVKSEKTESSEASASETDAPVVVAEATALDPNEVVEPTVGNPSVTTVDAPVETAAEVSTDAEAPVVVSFDSIDEARSHLLSQARDRIFKTVETARFHGRLIETLPAGEIRAAVEGELERQRRFPLDTANGLRGRLRREHFTIFKKGSKGVSYVCAVKRKFRIPGQTFSDSIGSLITFIEAHPMVKASELTTKYLDIHVPAAVPTEDATLAKDLTAEQRDKFTRMQGNLRWLVMEGYVTEFIDGRLFASPPIPESKKRDTENSDDDPESFPDAPAESLPESKAPVQDSKSTDVASATESPVVSGDIAFEVAPPEATIFEQPETSITDSASDSSTEAPPQN